MLFTPEGIVNCQHIKLTPYTDSRGSLCFAEVEKEIPFAIQRIFWIYNVPEDKARGGHVHWTCSEVIFPVSGGLEIYLDNGVCHQTISLQSPNEGIVIDAGVWCVLHHFKPNTVCMVVASEKYNPSGYEHDYLSFLNKIRSCK